MQVTIQDRWAVASSPEGVSARMPVGELMRRLTPVAMSTADVILPDGVKAVASQGRATIWVHQTPPRVYSFRWIARDSPAAYGSGTTYREVKIALPYLIVLAVFARGRDDLMHLTSANECFFRNEPLSSLDDNLHYPALLNCSRFEPPDDKPLAWICTQKLNKALFARERVQGRRTRLYFKALMHCLLETGFNYSSEHHEGSSWFTASSGVDERIATIESWEAATEENPMFVLDVNWLDVGMSVQQVMDRVFVNMKAPARPVCSSLDIARQVLNHGKKTEAGNE